MNKEIVGKNVILREQRDEDAAFFAYWYSQPDIMFKCGFTKPTSIEQVLETFHKVTPDGDWYTITDMHGRIIGETGLLRMWPEWFCTDLTIIIPDLADQGKGYGTDTINLMFDLAFHHYNLNRISIGVVGLNKSALNFYEKVGFKKEGFQEQGYYWNGEFSDFVMMRILKSEYLSLKTGQQTK
jgi:RimJ/RimL family protein N-acetyltransferase